MQLLSWVTLGKRLDLSESVSSLIKWDTLYPPPIAAGLARGLIYVTC